MWIVTQSKRVMVNTNELLSISIDGVRNQIRACYIPRFPGCDRDFVLGEYPDMATLRRVFRLLATVLDDESIDVYDMPDKDEEIYGPE